MLLDLLLRRYCIEPPPGLTPEQAREWVQHTQTPIRLRVFNVLRTWVSSYPEDFSEDDSLTRKLEQFIDGAWRILGKDLLVYRID
jgi:son of sevenless-like protein